MSVLRVKTSLVQDNEKGKYIVYPTSYADIVFLVRDDASQTKISVQDKFKDIEELIENNKELISKLEGKMKENNPFKGTYGSLFDLKFAIDYDDLKPGDYAIIAHEDEEDELYIFDINDREWISKGNIISNEIKMVNGILPNELGEIVIQIDNIKDLRELLNNASTKQELNEVSKKSMKFCQEWDDGTNYRYNDVVIYENCLYVWLGEETSLNVLPDSDNNWKLIAVSSTYVHENGGKIDTISVNGVTQEITNKNVNITMPTKTSDITNDSDFATNNSVDEKLSKIDVSEQIKTHNEDQNAHPYIQGLLPTVTKVEG